MGGGCTSCQTRPGRWPWALSLSDDKQPKGEPKPILTFSSMRLRIADMRPRDIGLSVAKDKLALAAAELSGTLWSVQR